MREISTLMGFELIRLCKAHRQRTEAALARLGLHVGQELLLLQLWQEDGLSQSQLAEAMEVDISTIGKAVQRMERAGLLSRSPDAQDARISRVYLTERGRALHESVVHVWHTSEARLVEGLTEVEQVLLRRLLRQMITSLS
ncbi:MAG TPA: MarR family transcriptional regulator [Ktedonobacterales bacterium]|nr:MarR family transcriptional regulator [Ktedonobacterales bacterium]